MRALWLSDLYLKNLPDGLERCDIVSFDVFDTLLYRACYEPGDVFKLVGAEIAKARQDWLYSPSTYKNLRIKAEQMAREKKRRGADCTFEDIFREFPYSDDIKNELKRIEIECEKSVLCLNRNMYSLLVDVFEKGKRIVVVSNMYYSGEQIMDFLRSAGVDISLINKVYVSSEQDCFKDSGELFMRVLADNPNVPPDRMIHIGDNEKADIIGAKKAGIRAVHYPVTNNKFGSIYDYERLKYNVRLGEIYVTRKLSTATNPYDNSELAFFYNFGAEIIGPLYTLFAEWVVRYAEKRAVNMVLAFMREGELLSKVINRAAKNRSSDVTCIPIFISRHPAFIASIFEMNYIERMSVLFRRSELNAGKLFGFFGIDVLDTPFASMGDTSISELPLNDRENLMEYLCSADVRGRILRYSKENRELLCKYVGSITKGKPVLTVDIGYKGTTQFFLNDIILHGGWEQEFYHALMMGVSQINYLNVFNGVDIITWLGFLGENEREIGIVYNTPILIECLINATCGSTYAYEEKDGEILPLLEDTDFDNDRIEFVKTFWEGIEAFQENYLYVANINPYMTQRLLEKKKDFLNILCRFMQCPSYSEAVIIGGLSCEDTFLNINFETFAGEVPPASLTEPEISDFIKNARRNGSYWPESAVTQVYPQYSLRKAISELYGVSMLYSDIYEVCESIKSERLENGYVFCASEICEKFCEFAKLFEIELKGVVDSDKRLHDAVISGLKVVGISDIDGDPDYFFVASYVYAKEVSRIILDRYRGQTHIPQIFLPGEKHG